MTSTKPCTPWLLSLASLTLLSACQAQTQIPAVVAAPASAAAPRQSSQLFAFDFNGDNPWPQAVASPKALQARVQTEAVGTIDTRNGPRSGALVLNANTASIRSDTPLQLALSSGPIPVQIENTQSNLGLLSLGFDVWLSELRPVRVRVQSLGANGQVTGSRVATLVPPVAKAWYRLGVDLNQTRAQSGHFDPRAKRMQLMWELDQADWPLSRGPISFRVDNVSLGAATFFVSATGSDQNDGRSEKTAFAMPQKAVDGAGAGDTIVLMNGTYRSSPENYVIDLSKAGKPAAWITMRAYPGHTPVINGNGWNIINLNQNSAYIELRGLTVHGNRARYTVEDGLKDGALSQKDGQPYYGSPVFNSNGIGVDARKGTEEQRAHHIRIIGNTIYENTGGGIGVIGADYVTVEGNRTSDNCHLMRYAGSGISVFRGWNFDQTPDYKNFVVGNIAHGNRTYVPWVAIGKVSDGNGIIIDDMINSSRGRQRRALCRAHSGAKQSVLR